MHDSFVLFVSSHRAPFSFSLASFSFKPLNSSNSTLSTVECIDDEALEAYNNDLGLVWRFFSGQARGGFSFALHTLVIAFILQCVMERACYAASRPMTAILSNVSILLLQCVVKLPRLKNSDW